MKAFLLALLLAQAAEPPAPLRLKDEGVAKGYVGTLNCVGAGISCTRSGTTGTLNVAGGSGTPGGAGGNLQTNNGSGGFGAYAGASCAYAVKTLDASGAATCSAAPADLSGEPFVTKTASANLSNEFALGSLTTGILLNTTTTGVPTIYAGTSCSANQYMNALDASGVKTCAQVATSQLSGTVTDAQLANNYSGVGACASGRFASTLNDNAAPTCTQVAYADVSGTPTIPADISGASYWTKVAEAGLSNEVALGPLATGLIKNTTSTGVPVIYGGTSCTNQFPRSLDASGAATCATVSLTADVTGVLPLATGGTNANLTASNGAVPYSDASKFVLLAPGASGQALHSAGAAAPAWTDAQTIVRLTSDYTNATTSMTNTALTWTSPAQVSRSAFTCKLMVKSSATTLGAQFDVTASVTPTTITYWVQWISATGTAPSTTGTWNHVTATANSTAIGPTAGLTTYTIGTVEGIIVHTASSSTVTIRGKASGVGTITVGSGSFCAYYVL